MVGLENNGNKGRSSSYQKIIVSLFAIVLIITLIIVVIQIKKESPAVGKSIERGPTPMEVPDPQQIDFTDGYLYIVPDSATVAVQYDSVSSSWNIPEEFIIEVVGNPDTVKIDGQQPTFDNYKFTVHYSSQVLSFKKASSSMMGYKINVVDNPVAGLLTISGETQLNLYKYDTKTVTFVELTFNSIAPKTTPEDLITLSDFVNVNKYGFNLITLLPTSAVIITKYKNLNMLIGYRMFEDVDLDEYGKSSLTMSKIQNQPTQLNGYSSKQGDCDDTNNLVNPNAKETCDGLDNNCKNDITDEICLNSLLVAVNDVFTPACGDDGDKDSNNCDPYENILTCPKDCISCPTMVSDSCTGTDTDSDGLSDAYEDYLNQQLGTAPITIGYWYNKYELDSDYDEVPDGEDFCPGTDNPLLINKMRAYTISNGRINFNGCYLGDIGTQDKGVRPDGCFNIKDSTFSIDYYAGSSTCGSYLIKK